MRWVAFLFCLLAPLVPAGAQETQSAEAAGLAEARAAMEKKIEEGDALLKMGDTNGALRCYQEAVALFREQRPARTPSFPAPTGDSLRDACGRGLAWLLAEQAPEGTWNVDRFGGRTLYRVGVSGLAALALLRAPQDCALKKKCAASAARALHRFLQIQAADGCFSPRTSLHFLYNHAIATEALCLGYERTKEEAYRESAQRAVAFLEAAQNPGAGWRYHVRSGDTDTSCTGWCVEALAAARHAGLEVKPATFRDALAWVEQMTSPSTGKTGYQQRGSDSARPEEAKKAFPSGCTAALTASGIGIRLVCGQDPETNSDIRLGTEVLVGLLPRWEKSYLDMDYWYAGTVAAARIGGPFWRHWSDALKTLLPEQEADGSWSPAGVWGPDGGRVYSTAIMTLCFEKCLEKPAHPK